MTNSDDATMADPGEKTTRFKLISHAKSKKKAKDGVIPVETAKNTLQYQMRILMNADVPSTKTTYNATFNPQPKTKTLMTAMAEHDPGLSITSHDGKSTLIINQDTFPTTEQQFKNFFTIEWEKGGNTKRDRILLGCKINGTKTLNTLKHHTKPSSLFQWLYKEKIYLESDHLGIGKTKTIGYLTNIHPRIINRTHTKENIKDTLDDIYISHEEAAKFDHTLQQEGTDSMKETDDTPTIHCPPSKFSKLLLVSAMETPVSRQTYSA